MTDEELQARFEDRSLPLDQWTHRSHVRIAYCYLLRYSFDDALQQLRQNIQKFNAAHDVPETPTSGYNETTTVAFLRLIDATMQNYGALFPTASGDAFCETHPQLMTPRALRLFYSPTRRMHPNAKTRFISPDLAPLPIVRGVQDTPGQSIRAFIEIVGLCVVAAIIYGIVHDQITARICVEYFTIGHPRVIESEDPTLLALCWGVIATWWVGVMLGVPLALTARAGRWRKVRARQLVRPLAIVLLLMGAGALIAGIAAWIAAKRGAIALDDAYLWDIPLEKRAAFVADAAAHLASYAGGFISGVALCIVTLTRRVRGRL